LSRPEEWKNKEIQNKDIIKEDDLLDCFMVGVDGSDGPKYCSLIQDKYEGRLT